jgi:nitronate monooxygenase
MPGPEPARPDGGRRGRRSALFATPITRLFGIRHPLLCGGLMLADARYVAAAVNAGGMGFITARTFPDLDVFRAELRLCAELTGGKPFGVNLFISGRAEENAVLDCYIEVLAEEGVRLIETAGNTPEAYLPALKAAGCIVMHKVSAVRHGLRAEKAGVDALAIVGQNAAPSRPAFRRHHGPGRAGGAHSTFPSRWAAASAAASNWRRRAWARRRRHGVAHDGRQRIWAHGLAEGPGDREDSRRVMASFRNTAVSTTRPRARSRTEAAGERDFQLSCPHVQAPTRDAYTTGDWERGILSMASRPPSPTRPPVAAIFAETCVMTARDRLTAASAGA